MPSGTLYLVATPIGNLEDISLRALRIFREVDLVAAEDTRRTAKLLTFYGIKTKTVSFHAHNARTRIPVLIAKLRSGAGIAVASDAGTPGISDPGVELVRACLAEGISIDPIPGASAPLCAAVASGFDLTSITILGFTPHRSSDRTTFLESISTSRGTVVFFESPHRITRMLEEAALILADRPIMVARELTKVHQEFLFGSASDLATAIKQPRGEFTVVVAGTDKSLQINENSVSAHIIAKEFGDLTESGSIGRREAMRLVARKHGVPVKSVYAAIESLKNR